MLRNTGLLLLLLLASARPLRGEPTWLTDLEVARQTAQEQQKDLLILFTGTAWCGYCEQLDYEVLQRAKFAEFAHGRVLVKFEFPDSEDKLAPKIRDQFLAWQKELAVFGFPTLFVADPQGRVYAVTGCVGETAGEFVARVEGLEQRRTQRDEAFARANGAVGLERARHLDEGLQAILPAFDEDYLADDGNYLLWFYRPEIEQIMAADADGAAGLRPKYQRLLDDQQERKQLGKTLERLYKVKFDDGDEETLRQIRQLLAESPSAVLAPRLRDQQVSLLESSRQHVAALELMRKFAADPALSRAERGEFREREAILLEHLGKADESLQTREALIQELGPETPAAYPALYQKALACRRMGRLDEVDVAWQRARNCAKPGTSNWRYGRLTHGRILSLQHRYDEAAALFTELAEEQDIGPADQALAWGELTLALALAGRRDEAEAWATKTEALLAKHNLPSYAERLEDVRSQLKKSRAQAPASPAQPAGAPN